MCKVFLGFLLPYLGDAPPVGHRVLKRFFLDPSNNVMLNYCSQKICFPHYFVVRCIQAIKMIVAVSQSDTGFIRRLEDVYSYYSFPSVDRHFASVSR